MKLFSFVLAGALTVLSVASAQAEDAVGPPDLMSFAQGVLPVSVNAGATPFKTGMAEAIRMIDGNAVGFLATPKPGMASDALEFVFAMPAPTRFDRFAVPNILETPSPFQTFFQNVEVLGSATSPEGPYEPIASGVLVEHSGKGDVTELAVTAQPDVLWVKVRLSGGLDVQTDKTFFEFSEIIGTGTQQPPDMSMRFSGVWKGRGVDIEMAQEGPTVVGCYDKLNRLTGTVAGNLLRATGQDSAGIQSQFIVIVAKDGSLRGLRSTNGAPFKPYDGEVADAAPVCLPVDAPKIGCGSVVHGIGFDFDSDVLRPGSESILAAMFEGLQAEDDVTVEIVGHSSSEGGADYNRDLSQRRAASVSRALVALGFDAARVSALGRGEDDPIAGNEDEAGRSLNRRVELRCTG